MWSRIDGGKYSCNNRMKRGGCEGINALLLDCVDSGRAEVVRKQMGPDRPTSNEPNY